MIEWIKLPKLKSYQSIKLTQKDSKVIMKHHNNLTIFYFIYFDSNAY